MVVTCLGAIQLPAEPPPSALLFCRWCTGAASRLRGRKPREAGNQGDVPLGARTCCAPGDAIDEGP